MSIAEIMRQTCDRQKRSTRDCPAVKEILPQLVLQHIFMDFEMAAINAAPATLSAAQILGCFFHLVRNLTKQLAEQGLLTTYNTDAPFALSARMIASLTFVSPSHLDAAVEALWDELPLDVHPILEWFERTYMGCWRRSDSRGPAIFPPSVWSVYESTLMGADQANKFAQAAHRRIRSDFGGDHPTLWKFVDGLRRVHAGRDQHYEEYIRGDEPPHLLVCFSVALVICFVPIECTFVTCGAARAVANPADKRVCGMRKTAFITQLDFLKVSEYTVEFDYPERLRNGKPEEFYT
ncbi:hypothetical protein M514_25622 [Trichuris suis]|uniref:MULE transposase domain-containing protein n=1 Tax=Trichuris suis TaxID=68888 RepID=A0A085MYD6_9BILA|nr:hypothetical protein M514_25622 [Trichuris suis]